MKLRFVRDCLSDKRDVLFVSWCELKIDYNRISFDGHDCISNSNIHQLAAGLCLTLSNSCSFASKQIQNDFHWKFTQNHVHSELI